MDSQRQRRRIAPWSAYLGACATLAVLYFFVPPLRGSAPVMNLLGLSPVVAILAGVRLHRPRSAAPWYWFAAGFALFWLGDVYTYALPKVFHHPVGFPSPGDAFYVGVYPMLLAGMVLLIRRRTPQRDLPGALDALIITVGLALISWIGLIAPYLNGGGPLLSQAVSIAYPLGDILLLAAAIRLALDSGRRGAAFYLMAAAMTALLLVDYAFGLAVLHGTFAYQLRYDTGWIAFYVLWGAAALHPSMRTLDEPRRTRPRVTLTRLAVLTAATLIAPVLELTLPGDDGLEQRVVVVASMVMFGFVVVRMAGLVAEVHRRTSDARLGALVQHGSDIITAVNADGIVIYQSPSIERALGIPAAELLGRRLLDFATPGGREGLAGLLAGGSPGESRMIEFAIPHRDGNERILEVQQTNLLEDEDVGAIVLNSRDVTERRAVERELEHQAFHDPVTGLANRALFAERVRHAVARARRTDQGFAVLFLDLDDFKTINDGLGSCAPTSSAPSRAASWSSSTSPSCTSATADRPAWRRSCAGTIRSAASSRRTSSSRWPRRPG